MPPVGGQVLLLPPPRASPGADTVSWETQLFPERMAEVPEEKRVPLTEGGRDLHRGHREERRALRAFAQAPAAGHRHRPGAVARVRAGRGRGCTPAFPGAEDSPAPPLLCGSVGETLVRNRSDGPGRAPAPRAPWTCWNLPAPEPASVLAPPRPCWGGPTPGNKDGDGREACPREATHQRPCLRESAVDSGLRPRCASPSLKHSSHAPRALPRWSRVRLQHGLCGAGPGPPRRPCGLGQVTSPAQHQLPAP